MDVRNESIGGYVPFGGGYGYGGYPGGYGCGFGGGGILGLIALLSLFRGHLGHGDYKGADNCLHDICSQLGSIRADIGDSKYDTVSNMLNQTMGLMKEISCGNLENLNALFNQTMHLDSEFKCLGKDICQVDKDVLINRYELGKDICNVDRDVLENRWILDKDIQKMGFENQIGNLKQTIEIKDQLCEMQHAADKCCCETNQNIERTAFQTQLRDLEYKNCTDKQLAELKCGQKEILDKITESRLLEENARLKDKVEALREKDERSYLAAKITEGANKSVATTYGHWWADRAFNGDTYPNPPYPAGAWPTAY